MKEKILIVEDQFIEANNLQELLEREGYRVCEIARSVQKALKIMEEERPDFVLLDIFLQGPLTGIDLGKTLREKNIPFVYLSANSNKETLDKAKATRPYGFLVKPFRERDVLVMMEIARYQHEHGIDSMKKPSAPVSTEKKKSNYTSSYNFRGIIGKSSALQTVLKHLQIVAPTETSVLILGENGTGKERIAECVHELSLRHSKPLVKVNCAALPTNLIESILFGHERGSFTGATERRTGKFEQANHGTIFLDEIGELCLEVQVKLLRVLQEKEFERIGGNETIKADVRIIAATNRNLEKEVAEGKFRMDLYYRLNVFPLVLPPLRDRKEDIAVLAEHFVDHFARQSGRSIEPLTTDLLNELTVHTWPGNIRELAHTMERTVLLTPDSRIKQLAILMPGLPGKQEERKLKTLEEAERDHIIHALKHCNGKVFGKGGAAELLGMASSTLNSKMKKLGIEKIVGF